MCLLQIKLVFLALPTTNEGLSRLFQISIQGNHPTDSVNSGKTRSLQMRSSIIWLRKAVISQYCEQTFQFISSDDQGMKK